MTRRGGSTIYSLIILLLLLIGLFGLIGWATKAEDGERKDTVGNFEISLLFEHDGVKVYRFRDAGEYVYFTKHSACSFKTEKIGDIKTKTPRLIVEKE